MIWYLVDILLAAFEVYIILSFYYIRLKCLISTPLILALAMSYNIVLLLVRDINNHIAINTAFSLLLCFTVVLMFKASWRQRIFYPIMIVAFGMAADMASALLYSRILGVPTGDISLSQHSINYLVGNITAKLLFYIFIRAMYRVAVRNDVMLPWNHWIIVIGIPVVSIFVCLGFAVSSADYIATNPFAPLLILIGILGINTLAFSLYDVLSSQSKKLVESERLRMRMEVDRKQYDLIVSQSRELASNMHDTKKHYEVISAFLEANNSDAALSYLNGVKMHSPERHISMANDALETVLSIKANEAYENGITVLINFDVTEILPIDDIVICMVIGNAMENAIEACQRLPNGANRLIDTDIRYTNERLTIRIANTSNEVIIENNRCTTSKSDKLLHGYGLLKIQKAVTDNGGNVTMRYENGRFIISIMFLF